MLRLLAAILHLLWRSEAHVRVHVPGTIGLLEHISLGK